MVKTRQGSNGVKRRQVGYSTDCKSIVPFHLAFPPFPREWEKLFRNALLHNGRHRPSLPAPPITLYISAVFGIQGAQVSPLR